MKENEAEMVILTLLAISLTHQVMTRPKDDLLMRPSIPDYRLIRQGWAQDDLQLSAEERKVIDDEIRKEPELSMKLSQERWKPGMPYVTLKLSEVMPETMALNRKYAKEIYALSVQRNGLLALLHPKIAEMVELSGEQREKVDAIVRGFYQWHDDEHRRLNGYGRHQLTTPPFVRFDGRPPRLPDEFITLKRTLLARWELRRAVTSGQLRKLSAIGGQTLHSIVPFGFTFYSAPHVELPYPVSQLLAHSRVHEELGLSMKESRLLLERLHSDRDRYWQLLRLEQKLLTPARKRRFRELEIQAAGPRAILWHDVRAELGVDPDRMDVCYLAMHSLHLAKMAAEQSFQDEHNALYRIQPYDSNKAAEIRKRQADYRGEFEKGLVQAANDAMTVEQRKELERMKGIVVPDLLPKGLAQ